MNPGYVDNSITHVCSIYSSRKCSSERINQWQYTLQGNLTKSVTNKKLPTASNLMQCRSVAELSGRGFLMWQDSVLLLTRQSGSLLFLSSSQNKRWGFHCWIQKHPWLMYIKEFVSACFDLMGAVTWPTLMIHHGSFSLFGRWNTSLLHPGLTRQCSNCFLRNKWAEWELTGLF